MKSYAKEQGRYEGEGKENTKEATYEETCFAHAFGSGHGSLFPAVHCPCDRDGRRRVGDGHQNPMAERINPDI